MVFDFSCAYSVALESRAEADRFACQTAARCYIEWQLARVLGSALICMQASHSVSLFDLLSLFHFHFLSSIAVKVWWTTVQTLRYQLNV